MSESGLLLHRHLSRISEQVRELLSQTNYTPPEGTDVSIKTLIETLLPPITPISDCETPDDQIPNEIRNFSLCCAALASSKGSSHVTLSWIPEHLQIAAELAFMELSTVFSSKIGSNLSDGVNELGLDYCLIPKEKILVVKLIQVLLPLLKTRIKESSIDASDEGSDVFAASARVPVAYAIVAAYQFRWLVIQVEYNHELGKLAPMVVPCGLTALDHWSPEVKGQGMISFIHLAKSADVAGISVYKDAILDACCQNIPSADEIWHLVVEMAVLLVTRINHGNPRSSWYEKMMNEMLSHVERQPRNKDRQIAWLQHIEPLFLEMGLVLLAHFRHLFPLFFQWMHADDDQAVILTLSRVYTVLRLTWIRNSPVLGRLVDELVLIYKEAALRTNREEIRSNIVQILNFLQQCKGRQFEVTWKKHMEDPNLSSFGDTFLTHIPAS